jgi:tRNA pseudouridine55 synthase
MNGFLCVNKPVGPSSFTVVKRVKSILHTSKVGHCGTLDPAAEGLLVIACNNATRCIPLVSTEPKVYECTIRFGEETDTLDNEGSVVRSGGTVPSREALDAVVGQFLGVRMQTPPRFSAVKIDGERAYVLARKNRDFTPRQKQVTIHSIDIESYDSSHAALSLRVSVSTGTYIRSLARDIAYALGSYAYAKRISRQCVGEFSLDRAVEYDRLSPETIASSWITLRDALHRFPSITADENQCRALLHGKNIGIDTGEVEKNGTVLIYNGEDELCAVTRLVAPGVYHPLKVFPQLRRGEAGRERG